MNNMFWLNDPSILMNKKHITNIWPKKENSLYQNLNAMTRLVILLTVVSYVLTKNKTCFLLGVLCILAVIGIYYYKKDVVKESFIKQIKDEFINKNHTTPKDKNPMMNILTNEISENPTRKEALLAYKPVVEKDINEKTKDFITKSFSSDIKERNEVKDKLFNDLGDSMTFDKSMRNFYTTPITTIPNEQKTFAEFLYGDMISCKEGHETACVRNNPRYTNY